MCDGLAEKVSVAVLSAAYAVEHLSDMILLILSNPIFCSSLVSIVLFFSSNSFSPLSGLDPHGPRRLFFSQSSAEKKLQFIDVVDRCNRSTLYE